MMSWKPRLAWFNLEPRAGGDWLLKVPHGEYYSALIDDAFPALSHVGWRAATYDHLHTYLKGVDEAAIGELRAFLEMLRSILPLCLNPALSEWFTDELDQCFALDYNFADPKTRERTDAGMMEFEAKYRGNSKCAKELAELLASLVMRHPALRSVDLVSPMPRETRSSNTLPDHLVRGICSSANLRSSILLEKKRGAPAVKDLPVEKKVPVLLNSLRPIADVSGKRVILVDDKFQSGATIWSAARCLKRVGAGKVYGLVCVKTCRDSDNR